jgi:hypothetical protein
MDAMNKPIRPAAPMVAMERKGFAVCMTKMMSGESCASAANAPPFAPVVQAPRGFRVRRRIRSRCRSDRGKHWERRECIIGHSYDA